MQPGSDSGPPINSRQWWEQYFRDHWDRNGGGAQTRHFMQRLLAELPLPEVGFLETPGLSIMDWGCAHGEGVDELKQRFPSAQVFGVDAAAAAIAEARRRFADAEFVHATGDAPPRRADVVISSNCLEHFAEPWPVAERLARAADQLLIVLVPCAEAPLCESHCVRFDAGDFPSRLGDLQRLAEKRLAVDPQHWGGDQLLVVYGSARYAARRGAAADSERDKWDAYYSSCQLEPESEAMARFGAEFAAVVSELLPDGGRVLEAGAGAGWHSLALARTGRFDVTLLDFSEPALRHARGQFERAGQEAHFVLGDAREAGAPDYDLVFNSGVLEHFAPAEQQRMVAAMASRSRHLVMALVPNSRCYWYWFWRVQAAAAGNWPFGSEVPAAELHSVFAAAGLQPLGERVLGSDWTESFLTDLGTADPSLRERLLQVHRSPLIRDDTKGYLLASLGRVATGAATPPPPGWQTAAAEPAAEAALRAALADALALQVRLQHELVRQPAPIPPGLLTAEANALALQAQLEHEVAMLRGEREAWQRGRSEAEARDQLQQRLQILTAEQAQRDLTIAQLQSQLRELTADAGRQRQQLEQQLQHAGAELAQLVQHREELLRARQELLAWQQMVGRSKTFRALRWLDRLRAALRPANWSRRPS